MLLIIGLWQGFRYAKLHLALQHAQREFTGRQFMRAEFWTKRALSVDAKNLEAIRLMAQINEAQDRPAALGWRIAAAQCAPRNTDDLMAWAKCALRFGQSEMALSALKKLPQRFQDHSAEFQELMAGCALSARQIALAGAFFAKEAEIGRDDPIHASNFATFRLTNGASEAIREAAGHELEGGLEDSRVRVFAARALLNDAIRRRDRPRAERLVEKLHSFPERTFSDDLTCLEVVAGERGFRAALDDVEHRAESDPVRIREAGDWLNAHGLAAETMAWFDRLSEMVQTNIPLQITAAESRLAIRDWEGLETFLTKRHWDDGEYLRRALLIRCRRERAEPWEADWKQLAVEMKAHPLKGVLLAQTFVGWKWRDEALDLLWAAATKPQTEAMALQALWKLYSATSETGELQRVANAQLELDPSDPAKKNNCAFLALLLTGSSARSERLAREALEAYPSIPEWAATYAFALHLAGKETEAKRVMEKLPLDALKRPGIALYWAIVLEASGDSEKAKEFLARLNPSGMLPEEQKLAADLAQQLHVASEARRSVR
ncbi:MAG TPA: hypothetical protein VGH90_03155 [Chthoniobacteraceae bacterium]